MNRRMGFTLWLCTIATLVVSALFLTSYVIYHAQVGSVPLGIRMVRRGVLFPRVILATDLVA